MVVDERGVVQEQARCIYHPQVEAVADCEACGRPYCRACLVELDGRSYCRPCAEAGAGLTRQSASELAVAALILSASSIAFCGITAIPGMILGFVELGKINRGDSPEAGRNMAKAAAIIGAVVTGLLVLSVLAAVLITVIGIIIAVLAA